MQIFSVPEAGKVKIDYSATIKLKGCAKIFVRLLKSKFNELGRTAMKGTAASELPFWGRHVSHVSPTVAPARPPAPRGVLVVVLVLMPAACWCSVPLPMPLANERNPHK